MSENKKKILQMLSEGKISVDEALRLLSLTGADNTSRNTTDSATPKSSAKYLYVVIDPKPGVYNHGTSSIPPVPPIPGVPDYNHRDWHGKVNVRVPLSLIRAGMKLATLIPPEAADKVNDAFKEKGINWDLRHFKDEDIEELVSALQDNEINIQSDGETVRVYAE
jgi:hypothetical protein